MALQTAKQSGSVDEFVAQFTPRLEGFVKSQDVLLRQNWQGASMSDLVHAHLELFAAEERARVSGPPIFLVAMAVQNIGFALHELATNASKHGALSTMGGCVVISWSGPGDDDRIRLEWAERGGPAVHSPVRRGSVTRCSRSSSLRRWRASTLKFFSDGLRWESWTFPAAMRLTTPVNRAETSR